MTDSVSLADDLLDLAVEVLGDLEAHHAPGLELPRVLAGHPVGADARADLAFTLGLLSEAGRGEVAGLSVVGLVPDLTVQHHLGLVHQKLYQVPLLILASP